MQFNYFNYPNQKLPNYGSVQYFAYRKLSDEKKEILYLLDQIKSQIISVGQNICQIKSLSNQIMLIFGQIIKSNHQIK